MKETIFAPCERRKVIMSEATQPKFCREVSEDLIKALKETSLWEKLKHDCEIGEVFLAIRNGNISFYHKGGLLFKFLGTEANGFRFQTHRKYAAVIVNKENDSLEEKDLVSAELPKNFFDAYDAIKANCALYSKHSEAEAVSNLYKSSYLFSKDVVLLDIEIAFQKKYEEDFEEIEDPKKQNRQDRCDVLLLNTQTKELLFVEAKLFENKELRAKNYEPKVIEQISRYIEQINDELRKTEIFKAYKDYCDCLEKIFGKLKLPDRLQLQKQVGLLVMGFDADQREGKLAEHTTKNSKMSNIPIYAIGDPSGLDAQTLWNGIVKK
jgi:hypothetical protein